MSEPLWSPSPESIGRSRMAEFIGHCRAAGVELPEADYGALYAWSIAEPAAFWEQVWEYCGLIASTPHRAVLEEPRMPGARWFPGARLNFAENLLGGPDEATALISVREGRDGAVTLTYGELRDQVGRLARFLRSQGVTTGDRVVGFLPNGPEAVVGMLATASLGAVWSSCSPDFGFDGVMERFGQIAPRVLITADGYRYGGKPFDIVPRARQVAESIASIRAVVVAPFANDSVDPGAGWRAHTWEDALAGEPCAPSFEPLPFDHPLYVMYSSGTTGKPKCIVHGAGGTLLQHAKELVLHTDLHPGDGIFYFTTCGWMMWNWLVSSLVVDARVVLYDGSPAHPDAGVLWRMVDEHRLAVFGTSPRFLRMSQESRIRPGPELKLDSLRAILSTGSPLPPESFEWVYRELKPDVRLSSICGGTDIISCFMLGSPLSPVRAGEIQVRGLGMKVEAWSDRGQAQVGEKGELVCTAPFPSMPVGFWDDPDGERYRRAYFDHYPGLWRHGDFVEVTEHGGVIVYGRSDATLNPGGVRIGTAEIYRQVQSLDEVVDSIAIGQPWDDDTRVVLFVVLRSGRVLDDTLRDTIRRTIRANATPRHVPAKIVQVDDVPRTISGKKVELAVLRVVQGEDPGNRDALANPEALEHYRDRSELET